MAICYRDRTFCEYTECKNYASCDRALTPQVQKDAEKWWGGKDAPICTYAEEPVCFKGIIKMANGSRLIIDSVDDPIQGSNK